MERLRKPFQGVTNILRFNWHFYFSAILFLIALSVLFYFKLSELKFFYYLIVFLTTLPIFSSLIVSCYIYDFSDLYAFKWMKGLKKSDYGVIVNVNAGFDETSKFIQQEFKNYKMHVFDFYDPQKHTEVSIKRARKTYPPFPGTIRLSDQMIPLPDKSVDQVLLIFSAHEIRNFKERVLFFKEINRIVKPDGRVAVTEHLRDFYNFMAYTIGFFHFYSRSEWEDTFDMSGLKIEAEHRTTKFVTTFILKKNGAAS